MRKLMNNPLFVGGLSVVALLFVFVQVVLPLWGQSADAGPEFEPAAPSSLIPELTQTEQVQTVMTSEGEQAGTRLIKEMVGWGETYPRDPFQVASWTGSQEDRRTQQSREPSLPKPDTDLDDLQLQAVSMEGETRVAVINREIVREGDHVEAFSVLRIQADGVWMQGPRGEERLEFQGRHHETEDS